MQPGRSDRYTVYESKDTGDRRVASGVDLDEAKTIAKLCATARDVRWCFVFSMANDELVYETPHIP